MKKYGRRCLSLSELTIELSWNDFFSENQLRALLSIIPFRDNDKSSCQPRIRLDFESVTTRFETSAGEFKLTETYDLSIFHRKDQTTITDGDSAFAIDHRTGNGRITLHKSFSTKTALAKSNFFLFGLIHLFAQYGYYDLHGAGLTCNGRGYLFLGPSGSGKSSLALNLVKQGWGYASDDSLLMNANKSDISVLSFRKNFYVAPMMAKRYPELAPALKNHNQSDSDKCFIDLDEIWPNRFRSQFVPGKIFFCHVTGGETSEIRPITKKDALLRLLPQSASVFFNQAFAQKQIVALKRLIEQTDCYALGAGLDVSNDSKKAVEILSGVE